MDSVGGALFSRLLKKLHDYLFNLLGIVTENLHSTAKILFTLYVIFMFYRLLKGKVGDSVLSFFISFLTVVVVYQFVFNLDQFQAWIYDPIISASLKLSGTFLTVGQGDSLESMFVKLDEVFGRIFEAIDKVGEKASFWDDFWVQIQIYVIGGAMALVFGVLYAVFIVLFMGGIFGLHVLFVMFGVVGILGAYPYTRHVFFAWLRGIFNYALIPVFTAIIMGITLQFLEEASVMLAEFDPEKDGGLLDSDAAGTALLIGAASIYFHFKAPEYAATITGGTASGMSGLVAPLAAVGGAAANRAAAGAQSLGVNGAAGARRLGKAIVDFLGKR